MIDDDELADRLRRTFEHVAGAAPVPPPPPLPAPAVGPLRRRPPTRWVPLAAAAAVLVAVAVAVSVDRRDDVEVVPPADGGAGPATDGPSPSSTVGPDGRVTARGADGGLVVVATVGPGPAPGLVAVDVDVRDDDGAILEVEVEGSTLPPAGTSPDECGGGATTARFGYTLGAAAPGPTAVAVRVRTGPCGGDAPDVVELSVVVPVDAAYAGDDGPRSPELVVGGGPSSPSIDADGVDGCLAEVLVDWGDRTAPTRLEVPPCEGSGSQVVSTAAHDYAPGTTATQRITVTSGATDGTGQITFLEREVTIP